MSDSELDRCPLCGGEVLLVVEIRDDNDRAPRPHRHYVIECVACELRLGHESPHWWSSASPPPENEDDLRTRATLIEQWNHRPTMRQRR